jgi:hypothetical protein
MDASLTQASHNAGGLRPLRSRPMPPYLSCLNPYARIAHILTFGHRGPSQEAQVSSDTASGGLSVQLTQ